MTLICIYIGTLQAIIYIRKITQKIFTLETTCTRFTLEHLISIRSPLTRCRNSSTVFLTAYLICIIHYCWQIYILDDIENLTPYLLIVRSRRKFGRGLLYFRICFEIVFDDARVKRCPFERRQVLHFQRRAV